MPPTRKSHSTNFLSYCASNAGKAVTTGTTGVSSLVNDKPLAPLQSMNIAGGRAVIERNNAPA